MTSKGKRPDDATELRKCAEGIAQEKKALSQENIKALSPEEIQQMLQELRVHQIELEMQNEELRTTRVELDAARARYFDLYDLAPVGYCTISEQGLILETNLAAATMLGMTRSALAKQPISRFILKEDQDLYYFHRKQLIEAGVTHEYDLRMTKNDGTTFWAHLAATVLQNAKGIPEQHIVLMDISDRKHAEELLLESEDLFRTLSVLAPAGIYLCDIKGKCQYANPCWCEMAGLSLEEVLGDGWVKGLHPKDRENVLSNWQQMVEFGGRWEFEYRFQTPAGKVTWVYGLATPQRDPLGNIVAYVGINTDITDRKRAEKVLQESEERFRKLFEDHTAVMLVIDPETGAIVDANNAAAQYYGWSIDELKRMRIQQINTLPPEAVRAEMEKAASLASTRFEFRHRKADGSIRDVEVFSNNIEIAGKSLLYSIVHDISKRKQAEDALRESEERHRTVANFTYDWEYWVSPENRFIYCSAAFQRCCWMTYLQAPRRMKIWNKFINPRRGEVIW